MSFADMNDPVCGTDMLKNTDLTGKNILVVDDNDLNLEIAAELLMLTGAEVFCAEDGAQAVSAVRERGGDFFSLILMDINMPVMDGYKAAAAIRAIESPYCRQVPIIAYSANIFMGDVRRSGMNDALEKPVDIISLCEMLKKWIK